MVQPLVEPLICAVWVIVCGWHWSLMSFWCVKTHIYLKFSILHKVCNLQYVRSVICSECVHKRPANPRPANHRLGAGLPVCTMQGNQLPRSQNGNISSPSWCEHLQPGQSCRKSRFCVTGCSLCLTLSAPFAPWYHEHDHWTEQVSVKAALSEKNT